MNNIYIIGDKDYLMHHGIKGQKWGERRFQNEDGTLTPEGKARYQKYVKEFGEATAKRLIESQSKGDSEKKAFDREFNRRAFGAKGKRYGVNVAGAGIGGIAGADAGALTGLGAAGIANAISRKKTGYDIDADVLKGIVNISSLAGLSIGANIGSSIADKKYGQKMSHLYDGYSEYEASADGIRDFYKRAKNFQKENP